LVLPEGDQWLPPEPDDREQRLVLDVLRDRQPHLRRDMVASTWLHERQVRAAISELRGRALAILKVRGSVKRIIERRAS
jgi:hypothetical protein